MNRNELIQEIEAAFSGVSLEDGIGIYEAERIDSYVSENEIMEARTKDRENWASWNEIPTNVISIFIQHCVMLTRKE